MSEQKNKQADQSADEDIVEWADDLDSDDISDILGFDLSAEDGEDRSGLKALINSALVSHRRMPMLDVVFDRAARQMTTSLRHLTNDNVDVTLDDISALRFGEFLQSVPSPTIVGVLKSEALNNYCLVAIDAGLVYSMVDLLLGGRRGGTALVRDGHNFTQIEIGLVRKVVEIMAADLTSAMAPVADVDFALARIETTPRFAAIAQDASVCSLAKFTVAIDERGGRAAILFPHATLEPVQKIMRREFISEAGAGEQNWITHLSAGVAAANVELMAVAGHKNMTISELSELRCGDTLVFSGFGGASADLVAGALKLACADVGRAGARIALRLRDDPEAGEIADGLASGLDHGLDDSEEAA